MICQVTINDFAEWLNNELMKRGWTQADLARISKIDDGVISRARSGERSPKPETLISIAQAFRIPPEEVFQRAGLLPPKKESDLLTREAEWLLGQLDDDGRNQAIDYIRYLAQRQEEKNAAKRMGGPALDTP